MPTVAEPVAARMNPDQRLIDVYIYHKDVGHFLSVSGPANIEQKVTLAAV